LMPEETAEEYIDFIVIGFDENERILVSPTSGSGVEVLERMVGCEVRYEDYRSVIWRGRVVEATGDVLVVVFGEEAGEEGIPPGLGQGSLVRIAPRPA